MYAVYFYLVVSSKEVMGITPHAIYHNKLVKQIDQERTTDPKFTREKDPSMVPYKLLSMQATTRLNVGLKLLTWPAAVERRSRSIRAVHSFQ